MNERDMIDLADMIGSTASDLTDWAILLERLGDVKSSTQVQCAAILLREAQRRVRLSAGRFQSEPK